MNLIFVFYDTFHLLLQYLRKNIQHMNQIREIDKTHIRTHRRMRHAITHRAYGHQSSKYLPRIPQITSVAGRNVFQRKRAYTMQRVQWNKP